MTNKLLVHRRNVDTLILFKKNRQSVIVIAAQPSLVISANALITKEFAKTCLLVHPKCNYVVRGIRSTHDPLVPSFLNPTLYGEILPIQRKTLSNQSTNQSIFS